MKINMSMLGDVPCICCVKCCIKILEELGNKFKKAGCLLWDAVLAKLWKSSRHQGNLQRGLTFREMKTADDAQLFLHLQAILTVIIWKVLTFYIYGLLLFVFPKE